MNIFCDRCKYRYKEGKERIEITMYSNKDVLCKKHCDYGFQEIGKEDLTEIEKECYKRSYLKFQSNLLFDFMAIPRNKISWHRNKTLSRYSMYTFIDDRCPFKLELEIMKLNNGDNIVE